jgi:hypothetical protein
METFLTIALAVSVAYIIVQAVMLYKMAEMLRESQPPF